MRISTVFCSVIFWSACGSGKNSPNTNPPLAPTETPPGSSNAGGQPGSDETGQKWRSDITDAVVTPCANGQIFAKGTCFDELNFSEDRLELKSPGTSFVVFSRGQPMGSDLANLYRYSSGYSSDRKLQPRSSMKIVNEGISRLKNYNYLFLGYPYWFLPLEMEVSQDGDGRDLSSEKISLVEFPLNFSFGFGSSGMPAREWSARGTATFCGKSMPLPVTQKNLEEACNQNIGSATTVTLNSAAGGSLVLDFGIWSDGKPDLLARPVVGLKFNYRFPVDGSVL